MDIEKLIETLKNLEACAYGYHINGEVLGMDCSDFEQVMVDAAEEISKISTLQAENEKLKADLARVTAERDAAVESIPHECKTCVHHTVFFNGCTPDHDCTNPDGGCSNNCDRWKWRGVKKED